jgi:hypothetical protein
LYDAKYKLLLSVSTSTDLFSDSVSVSQLVLRLLGQLSDVLPIVLADYHNEGDTDKGHYTELPAEVKHEQQCANCLHKVTQKEVDIQGHLIAHLGAVCAKP